MEGNTTPEQPLAAPDLQKQPPEEGTKPWLMVSIAAVVLLAVGVAAYFLFWHSRQAVVIEETPQVAPPSGSINLSLFPIGGETSGIMLGLYQYDIETGSLVQREMDPALGATFQGVVSPDGTKLAHISWPGEADYPQVYISDLAADGSVTNSVALTTSEGDKRNLAWSADGTKIAFNVMPPIDVSGVTATAPSDWQAHAVTLDGIETSLGSGMFPAWSPDGHIVLLLRNDGIWAVHTETGNESQMLYMAEGKNAHVSMQFSVSADGTRIAYPNPSADQIVVYRVQSWNTAKAVMEREIPIAGFWPRFSPDGRHLTFEALEFEDSTHPRVVRAQSLAVYSFETGEVSYVADLNPYVQESMWIDGWVPAAAPVVNAEDGNRSGLSKLLSLFTPARAETTICHLVDEESHGDHTDHIYECENGGTVIYHGTPGCDNFDGEEYIPPPSGGGSEEEEEEEDFDCDISLPCSCSDQEDNWNQYGYLCDEEEEEEESNPENMNIQLRGTLQGGTCNQTSVSNIASGSIVTLCWQDTNGTAQSCTATSNPSSPATGFSTGNAASGSDNTNGLTVAVNFRVTCWDQWNNSDTSNWLPVTISALGTPTISADPDRVREGTNARLNYNTGGRNCTITSALPSPWNSWAVTGSGTTEPFITGIGDVTFTMTCDGSPAASPVSATIRILPAFQEI